MEAFGPMFARISLTLEPLLVMLLGLWLIFRRMDKTGEGFTQNSLRAIGMILFIPMLPLISVGLADFKSEALAALLGTVAGYVLSGGTTAATQAKGKTNTED